ncbi:MAG: TPM domain-containing protein [Burkholderiales bacterium]
MLSLRRVIHGLCLLGLAQCAQAAAAVPVPAQTGLIVDQAKLLTEVGRATFEKRLQAIQTSGRAQVAILISSGIQGEPLADYSLRVADAWQLGRTKRDDGLLILVVPATNAARIEVGYGLEGEIPDARASQWIDELLPAIKQKQFAPALDHLLDEIETALPAAKKSANDSNYLFPAHAEWRLPFVLVVFSMFALFPLMFGRGGGIASAFLLAAFYGGAAWALWNSRNAGLIAAGIALPLPLLWALNWTDSERLPRMLRYAKTFGNLCAVAMFFSIITLFTGVGLWAGGAQEIWAAPIFSGLLALGLAAFLFPAAQSNLLIVLRSACHFAMILIVAYLGLEPFVAHPAGVAFSAAAAFTALIALSLLLGSRERTRDGSTRWSLWLVGIALLIALPFGLLLLVQAVLGEDLQGRIAQAAAGGGSLGGILWWAARQGFFSALTIGLGGRFGGGGAGRGD